jgi:hypothetical protein
MLQAVEAGFISEFWNEQIVEQGREGVFLVLVGFLGSFLFIRTSTRLMRSPRVPWWPGSVVTDGGVHLHHLVFGIVLMLIAPTIAYAIPDQSPWWEITALLFGIGAGLTFDEFALWVHLRDVYWAEEGRRSVDATVIAAMFIGLVFLGTVPFEIDSADVELFFVSLALSLTLLALCVICFLKGRLAYGFVGIFIQPFAIVAASRLAKPDSAWARRFYGERNPDKQRRAEERYRDRRVDRLKERFRDALGGATEATLEARREQPPS